MNTIHKRHLHLILAVVVLANLAGAQQAQSAGPHQHGSMMGKKDRADKGMGFD